MTEYSYPVRIEPEVGGWCYTFLDWPSTLARGRDHDEARDNAEAVLRLLIGTHAGALPQASEAPWNGTMITVDVDSAFHRIMDGLTDAQAIVDGTADPSTYVVHEPPTSDAPSIGAVMQAVYETFPTTSADTSAEPMDQPVLAPAPQTETAPESDPEGGEDDELEVDDQSSISGGDDSGSPSDTGPGSDVTDSF